LAFSRNLPMIETLHTITTRQSCRKGEGVQLAAQADRETTQAASSLGIGHGYMQGRHFKFTTRMLQYTFYFSGSALALRLALQVATTKSRRSLMTIRSILGAMLISCLMLGASAAQAASAAQQKCEIPLQSCIYIFGHNSPYCADCPR
ncbi:hypothetical protein, partial [Burkholderia ubonensis]|uniref:hypothetical protein n=1 Tax=Burkholderia ubonensis TaxID=101571 RepID=UPI001E3CA6B9